MKHLMFEDELHTSNNIRIPTYFQISTIEIIFIETDSNEHTIITI